LSFLRKLVREEISLMSDGSAFQPRGPAMENAFVSYMKRIVIAKFGLEKLETYLYCMV